MIRIVARAVVFLFMTALMVFGSNAHATMTADQADASRAASARQVRAAGAFLASVDFSTLITRDVGKSKCEFRVQGTLTFTGTLEGVASGTTRALIDAPCREALNSAPGAFRDVFRFNGRFDGTVDGVPAEGSLDYAGVTRPGGSINAGILLRAEAAKATLRTVDARLGVGGLYRGVAVTKD